MRLKLIVTCLFVSLYFTVIRSQEWLNNTGSLNYSLDGDQERLLSYLTSKHDPRVLHRPNGQPLNVSVTLEYPKLIQLNADDQTVNMIIELMLIWTDQTLSWDPGNFSGIDLIFLPRSLVFIPDIVIYSVQSVQDLLPDYKQFIRIGSTGVVEYYMAQIDSPVCELDVAMFPFDTQTCTIQICSYQLMHDQLVLYPIALDNYDPVGNGEWLVGNFTATRQILQWKTSIANLSYDNVVFTYPLQRRPTYYITVIIIPTFMLASVCILGLFGPKPDTADIGPEKVPLSLATLMSMTVLLSIASGSLPKNSLSILGKFILLEIGLCASAALVSVVISFVRSLRRLMNGGRKKNGNQAKITLNVNGAIEWIPGEKLPITGVENFLAWTSGFGNVLRKVEKKLDEKQKKADNAANWNRIALKLNIGFVILFEMVNCGILVYIMQYWQ